MMKVMAFDLSSVCIGVVAADVNGPVIRVVKSAPIIPPEYDHTVLGYEKYKRHVLTGKSDGAQVMAYVRNGETRIPEAEKLRRDVQVRNAKNNFLKEEIGKQISMMIQKINPDIILVEKNSIFNGVLTSVLLGEIMGILEGIASSYGIKTIKYTVGQARKPHNVSRLCVDFAKKKTPQQLRRIKDLAKAALREKMESKYGTYGFTPQTDDESDACVIFDYWYEFIYKKGEADGEGHA